MTDAKVSHESVSRCLRCGSGRIEGQPGKVSSFDAGGRTVQPGPMMACGACGHTWTEAARSPGPSGVGTDKVPDKVPSDPEPAATTAKASPATKGKTSKPVRHTPRKRSRPSKRSGSK